MNGIGFVQSAPGLITYHDDTEAAVDGRYILIVGCRHGHIGIGDGRPLVAEINMKLRQQGGARKGRIQIKRIGIKLTE